MSAYVWLTISSVLAGIGMGLLVPAGNNAVLHLAPESTAAVSGIRGMFRQSGGITGISIIAAVAASSGDPGLAQAWAFAAFSVVLVALIPLVALVPEHRGTW